MSDPRTTPLKHDAELMRLLSALCDETITDADLERLETILRADPAARTLYRRYIDMAAELQVRSKPPVAGSASIRAASDIRVNLVRYAAIALSLAAVLLVCAAAVAIYLFAFETQPENQGPTPDAPVVATLIDATDEVSYQDNLARPGGEYAAGVYSIPAGTAEFVLASRVTVNTEGPTEMTLHTPMHASVAHGSARFNCPKGAVGFTVSLPDGTRIVDLGTEFTVTRSHGEKPTVSVSSGRVAVYRSEASDPTIVVAGEIAVIDDDLVRVSTEPALVLHRRITRPEDIANSGRLIKAISLLDRQETQHWNVALPVTVNGIDFATSDVAIGPEWAASEHRGATREPSPATDEQRLADPLRELLTSIAFAKSGTVQLTGLRPGATYRLQLLHYERAVVSRRVTIALGDRAPIDYTLSNSDSEPYGDALVFTWTADTDHFMIRYEGDREDAVLSAVVLHEIDRGDASNEPEAP